MWSIWSVGPRHGLDIARQGRAKMVIGESNDSILIQKYPISYFVCIIFRQFSSICLSYTPSRISEVDSRQLN